MVWQRELVGCPVQCVPVRCSKTSTVGRHIQEPVAAFYQWLWQNTHVIKSRAALNRSAYLVGKCWARFDYEVGRVHWFWWLSLLCSSSSCHVAVLAVVLRDFAVDSCWHGIPCAVASSAAVYPKKSNSQKNYNANMTLGTQKKKTGIPWTIPAETPQQKLLQKFITFRAHSNSSILTW